MNQKVQIAKNLSTEVLALMADWQEIRGRFYLADHAQNHYGEETLLDVLNHPGKAFIPFCQEHEDSVVLIHKTRIVGLQPSGADYEKWPRIENVDDDCWQAAKMAFAGFTLEGRAYTGDMEPHRRRLADLLNLGQTFFVFETDDGPWIVNRDLLNHLVPLA